MALYEMRTLWTQRRVSLISYAEFSSDLTAILTARTLLRRGKVLRFGEGKCSFIDWVRLNNGTSRRGRRGHGFVTNKRLDQVPAAREPK
jgi:hypothetical protein